MKVASDGLLYQPHCDSELHSVSLVYIAHESTQRYTGAVVNVDAVKLQNEVGHVSRENTLHLVVQADAAAFHWHVDIEMHCSSDCRRIQRVIHCGTPLRLLTAQ